MTSGWTDEALLASIPDRFKQGVFMDEEAYLFREHETGVEGIKLIKQSLKDWTRLDRMAATL